MAEWLGSGLQNHLQRFESARDLREINPKRNLRLGFFVPENEQSMLSRNVGQKNTLGEIAPCSYNGAFSFSIFIFQISKSRFWWKKLQILWWSREPCDRGRITS